MHLDFCVSSSLTLLITLLLLLLFCFSHTSNVFPIQVQHGECHLKFPYSFALNHLFTFRFFFFFPKTDLLYSEVSEIQIQEICVFNFKLMVDIVFIYFFSFDETVVAIVVFSGYKSEDSFSQMSMQQWGMIMKDGASFTVSSPYTHHHHHQQFLMPMQHSSNYHLSAAAGFSDTMASAASQVTITEPSASSSSSQSAAENKRGTSHLEATISPPFIDFLGVGA